MVLDVLYYLALIVSIIIGFIEYKKFNSGTKIVFFIILMAFIDEALVFICRYKSINSRPVYHVYCVIDFFLMTLFFFKTIFATIRYLYINLAAITILTIGLLNCFFFQPITKLNSNMLVLESFCVIIMSLFALYKILIDDTVTIVFKHPNFWFWVFFLILYTGTFFFWSCIVPLSKNYKIIDKAQDIQVFINVIVYFGIGSVFFCYPKMVKR